MNDVMGGARKNIMNISLTDVLYKATILIDESSRFCIIESYEGRYSRESKNDGSYF